jgi:hypothetical protein
MTEGKNRPHSSRGRPFGVRCRAADGGHKTPLSQIKLNPLAQAVEMARAFNSGRSSA